MKSSLSCALLVATAVFAAETKVRVEDTPAAVRKTIQEETRNATLVGLTKEREHGKTVYELETKVGGKSRDLMIGTDGAVLSVEEEVAIESIPAPAKMAIETKAAGGHITKVEVVKEGGAVAYEAAIVVKGKRSEIKVSADGSMVK